MCVLVSTHPTLTQLAPYEWQVGGVPAEGQSQAILKIQLLVSSRQHLSLSQLYQRIDRAWSILGIADDCASFACATDVLARVTSVALASKGFARKDQVRECHSAALHTHSAAMEVRQWDRLGWPHCEAS